MEKVTDTLENYLKSILLLSDFRWNKTISLGKIAKNLQLSPGTVTVMIKRFKESGWVDYFPRTGCILTSLGTEKAISVLKKHRIIECFLVNSLEMNWSDVHQEAEILEHSLSDRVIEKLDKFLDYPECDPHGTKIIRSITDITEKY